MDPHRSWKWTVLHIAAISRQVDAVPGGCRVTSGVPCLAWPYLLVCRPALRRMAAELDVGVEKVGTSPGPT
jgi:hypothetical protein